MGCHLINIEKVDILGTPLKVVHELTWAVALLEDKSIVKKFIKFMYYIYILEVSDPTGKFS